MDWKLYYEDVIHPLRLGSASQSDFCFLKSHPGGYIKCRSIRCISTDLYDPENVQSWYAHRWGPGWYQLGGGLRDIDTLLMVVESKKRYLSLLDIQ
jgi:hypothetical protein